MLKGTKLCILDSVTYHLAFKSPPRWEVLTAVFCRKGKARRSQMGPAHRASTSWRSSLTSSSHHRLPPPARATCLGDCREASEKDILPGTFTLTVSPPAFHRRLCTSSRTAPLPQHSPLRPVDSASEIFLQSSLSVPMNTALVPVLSTFCLSLVPLLVFSSLNISLKISF